MLLDLAFGITTWWEKLKVWRLEINENIVIIGQCKAVVCLLTSYKAKIGVSRCGILVLIAKSFNCLISELYDFKGLFYQSLFSRGSPVLWQKYHLNSRHGKN